MTTYVVDLPARTVTDYYNNTTAYDATIVGGATALHESDQASYVEFTSYNQSVAIWDSATPSTPVGFEKWTIPGGYRLGDAGVTWDDLQLVAIGYATGGGTIDTATYDAEGANWPDAQLPTSWPAFYLDISGWSSGDQALIGNFPPMYGEVVSDCIRTTTSLGDSLADYIFTIDSLPVGYVTDDPNDYGLSPQGAAAFYPVDSFPTMPSGWVLRLAYLALRVTVTVPDPAGLSIDGGPAKDQRRFWG